MGLYFGTDGLRGIFGKTLTLDMAFRVGRAIALEKENSKILVGRDTRKSGEVLSLAFSLGAICEGADIFDTGVCPTAGISYLTNKNGYDFGVVISASHNPSEFNGIKIFNDKGEKIGDLKETEIEKRLFLPLEFNKKNFGKYFVDNLIKEYEAFLLKEKVNLEGLKIVLDCANGASFEIANTVFNKLGADVISINCEPNGENINLGCGATDILKLKQVVVEKKADMGFAFDGDSDRVIAIDEKGNIVDGDMLIYLFAMKYLAEGRLKNNQVVGTAMTNTGIENALKRKGIELLRTNVGDKYVNEILVKNNLLIGGEQCGHIFLKDELATGDGILNAILVAEICKKNNKKLSEFFDLKKHYQVIINIKVKNKNKVLNCKKLINLINNLQNGIKNNIRILVRGSGTEAIIRVMVESENKDVMEICAKEIKEAIEDIDRGNFGCVV